MSKINLTGSWSFCLDKEKIGMQAEFYKKTFKDSIELPTTVSEARKGTPSDEINTGFLTDPYLFEGYTWYSKQVDFADVGEKELFLILERTRISHLWIDETYVGSYDSLCTSHRYCLTPFIHKPQHRLTIMVDNTSYPTRGGHMTSPDTQTNWNGITGDIYIEVLNKVYLTEIKLYTVAKNKQIKVAAVLNGAEQCAITAYVSDEDKKWKKDEHRLCKGQNLFSYSMDETATSWSEHFPKLYTIHLTLKPSHIDPEKQEEILKPEAEIIPDRTLMPDGAFIPEEENTYAISFGLRDFKATGNYFEINGKRTFLRGKHDGMIFPLTGYAPTDVESWMKVLSTAKSYGINHYRFHTCCPPEAAFTAADILGMYMEPELPFWGTITVEGEENHDEEAQQYLIQEGFQILDAYGNHPSFVMMSLGNELWGSKERLNEILGEYRIYDNRHLYTQGSNNFQFMPCILENEDFFCGVRFSRDRLFRGSYAMCDAPQGHIQTMPPQSVYNYDQFIRPTNLTGAEAQSGEVTIQYGTRTKTVKMDASNELIPQVPVISHEIGQYAMLPDYSEISKYTGVLKPRNLEAFQKRLKEKGLLAKAEQFFKASGRFAAECYKAELETALRSNELAGFQLLDLQDFSGQGTALVGILNAFMENKGHITASEWRQFCSDRVLLAELPGMVYQAGQEVHIKIKLACFSPIPVINPKLEITISAEDNKALLHKEKEIKGRYINGVFNLQEFLIKIPELTKPAKLNLSVRISGSDIENHYDLWEYPDLIQTYHEEDICITERMEEAILKLQEGRKVLLYPDNLNDTNSITGTYCTDFWCYPMFRSISESMGRPVPVGTHGLLIDRNHAALEHFPSQFYTTPQWYDIVTNSRAMILDDIQLDPIVYTIDNFERNHRLGNILEVKAGKGKLLVCTCNLRKQVESLPARWLEYSLLQYMNSDQFEPKHIVDIEELRTLLS